MQENNRGSAHRLGTRECRRETVGMMCSETHVSQYSAQYSLDAAQQGALARMRSDHCVIQQLGQQRSVTCASAAV